MENLLLNFNTVSDNLTNVCRICLSEAKTRTELFSENESSKEILKKIYLCFQIILSFEKYLPCVICNNCVNELDMADKFRLKCINFEKRFTTYCEELSKKSHNNDKVNEMIGGEHDQLLCSEESYDHDIFSVKLSSIENSNSVPETCIETKQIDLMKIDFKCNICNKILKTKASLQKHSISMHKNRKHAGKITGFGSSRRYHCTKCSYSTPHSQTLVNHIRRHNGDRPFHCECGKSFTQSASLSAHFKTHSTTTYYTCSICGKQFKHGYTLKSHLNVHESGSFTCTICYKTLKSKKTLQDHMHRHYNIRNYNCEDCGDTFVTSAELLNHRKKHDIQKKVECHVCGYKTTTKKNLIIHLKRHTGDKSFKCDSCEITFYTKGDLRRHQRVHTREKPYSCQTCTQRFTHSSSLNKHMRNVHCVQYKWGDHKSKETRKNKFFMKNGSA